MDNNDLRKPLYTLGIASQLSEIPMHSIRQYIQKGLIIPFKLDSKRHLFSQSDIERLKNIQVLIHEHGLNFAGIRALMGILPCWEMRKCSDSDRKTCNAYNEAYIPCWESSEKGRKCKNENCRECDVYAVLDQDIELKSIIKSMI